MNGLFSPNRKLEPKDYGIGIFIAIIVLAVWHSGLLHSGSDTSQKSDPNLYSAADLNAYYQKNEVKADQQFKDVKIRITGQVGTISKDAFGGIYITLGTGEFLEEVHCDDLPENEAAQLQQGQTVNVDGKCTGLLIGSVMLSDCTLEK